MIDELLQAHREVIEKWETVLKKIKEGIYTGEDDNLIFEEPCAYCQYDTKFGSDGRCQICPAFKYYGFSCKGFDHPWRKFFLCLWDLEELEKYAQELVDVAKKLYEQDGGGI